MTDTPEPEMDAPPAPDTPAAWIERPGALAKLAARVATAERVAIDTESNSMHAYREQTCIVQVTVDGENAIIDALAIESLAPLREAVDRADVEVLFHGGDYDISCLSRDHGFAFHRVFDTMIAATLLGEERLGLAHLVESIYGDALDKRFQRADWARRPLSTEQLDYLRRDTLYLPGLREVLGRRLEEADLVEEATIEFRRLAGRRGRPFEPDPEAWRRIKGANRLDDLGRCVLHALNAWREGVAEARDRPPFKVLAPRTMLKLAAQPPKRAHHPRTVPFLSHGERSRYGRAIVAALQRAFEAHAKGDIPARAVRPTLTPTEAMEAKVRRARTDALKAWRRTEIDRRKVPGVVVLPNPAIAWLSAEDPTTLDELAACPDIGPKRIARYGKAILAALADLRR
ncbi:MAG: HRDC domain-containing protein [Planctomycetota bacterium]|nr:HRDC domain-containing protein [Planctomycetota bacterium]